MLLKNELRAGKNSFIIMFMVWPRNRDMCGMWNVDAAVTEAMRQRLRIGGPTLISHESSINITSRRDQ